MDRIDRENDRENDLKSREKKKAEMIMIKVRFFYPRTMSGWWDLVALVRNVSYHKGYLFKIHVMGTCTRATRIGGRMGRAN